MDQLVRLAPARSVKSVVSEADMETTKSKWGMRASGWMRALVVASCLCAGASVSTARAQERQSAGHEVREEVHQVRAERWRHPRLRFGVSGEGGGFFGATHGGIGGLALRIGVQLNDIVGVYLQGHGLVGEYVPDPRPTSLVGVAFHEMMVDVTLLDMIQLGAGPSLDVVWGCEASNYGNYCGRSGAFFGGDFRAAIIAFARGPERRHGLVFSVDAHPTWLGNELMTTMLFGIGGEIY
jgi:hypothetical protein